MGVKSLIFLALFAWVVTGCSERKERPSLPGAAKGEKVPIRSGVEKEEASLPVKIIPDPPTADGCLKALVSSRASAEYRWEVNGLVIEGADSNVLCEGFRRDDQVEVTVTAGDSVGSRSVTIENAPPRITEVRVNGDGVFTRADLVVEASVVDADDDLFELRYQWYVNDEADPFLTGDTLSGGRYGRDDAVRFTIIPSDGFAEGTAYRSETLIIPNAPPRILSSPPGQFETLEFNYRVEVWDPDGDSLSFTLDTPPQGMRIDASTGEIVWSLTGVVPGEYAVKIVARDSEGAEAVQEFTLIPGVPADIATPEKDPLRMKIFRCLARR